MKNKKEKKKPHKRQLSETDMKFLSPTQINIECKEPLGINEWAERKKDRYYKEQSDVTATKRLRRIMHSKPKAIPISIV